MLKLVRIWIGLTSASFQSLFVSKLGALLFLFGKLLRFFFFLSFLVLLSTKTKVLAGYSMWQILLFYVTFNFIDSTSQMFFRDVYRFRRLVITGNFDFVLLKPIQPLFRILFGGADLMDLFTLFPFILFIVFITIHIPGITFFNVIIYALLILNAFIIAASFHIFVVSLAVITTEIDHAIMIYRDFTGMGKLPIHVYSQPLQSLVTFIIPVGIMMTYPVDALLGILSIKGIIIAVSLGISLLIVSLQFWKFSINKYTSASS